MDDRPGACSECLRTARQWVANPQSLDEVLGFCSDTCQQRHTERLVGAPPLDRASPDVDTSAVPGPPAHP